MSSKLWRRAGRGLALTAAICLGSAAAAAQDFVTILTGGTTGVYYPLGVAMSQIYGKGMPNAKITVQATKASVENLNLLQAGKGEIGFSLSDSVSQAVKGDAEAGFAKPLDKLRTVATIYPNYIQIVASKDSGIKTLADIKGKRISVGAPKSGTELNARAIVKAAGMTYADFAKVEYLPFAESVDLMKNRQIDVTLQSAGLGVASIKDLAASLEIVMVPIPADVVAKVGDPVYQSAVIPANTYTGQSADVPSVAIGNVLVTHAGVPDEAVYQMTKQLYGGLDQLVAAHAAAKAIKLDASSAQGPAPLHPGAARFFKEKGLVK
ncbi:MAG TPA: TAXI family TRAP transporter solute-binding subunit [Azospirillaceae bacterium]|nr:TAXI family TRAP transporter solute-binding subunit [Azospirillaceae bacterium]